MDFHLERRLRLNTEPKHENLYKWAIQEIDAQGRQIGHDQIPWQWTLHFTATSCVLLDEIEIESREESAPASPEIAQRQHIRVRLRPGRPWEHGDYSRETTFSMFGTDRAIKHFDLHIYSIADPSRGESCSAWGAVSYTTEIDFRHETSDDVIAFYLLVNPDTFARCEAKIAHGLVDEIVLSVGSVAGFYSEWSPSISTRNVKVLTGGSEQNITLLPGQEFEPPRLGHVGKTELHINRRLEFRQRGPEPDSVGEASDSGTERALPETQAPPAVDARMLRMLVSLRWAAWFVVGLLALISVELLNR